jgi:Ca2+-binding EF-hand superfamily protein
MAEENKKTLEDVFAVFDKDGSGKIESKELAAALKEYYNHIKESVDDAKIESDVQAILASCDQSGDGKIDKAEWLKHFGY